VVEFALFWLFVDVKYLSSEVQRHPSREGRGRRDGGRGERMGGGGEGCRREEERGEEE
jgi:hypothetical protein